MRFVARVARLFDSTKTACRKHKEVQNIPALTNTRSSVVYGSGIPLLTRHGFRMLGGNLEQLVRSGYGTIVKQTAVSDFLPGVQLLHCIADHLISECVRRAVSMRIPRATHSSILNNENPSKFSGGN